MPWFKIDDKHHDHTKTRMALRGVKGKRRDAGAMGLWELAGSWSADNLMDGFVPTDELFRWDDDWELLAARLVAAGYWEPVERGDEEGYQFINWDEHQPTKADVESKREAARERMRNIRSGSQSVRANSERSSQSVQQPRPVTSRPDPSPKEIGDKSPPAKRATQLPKDWQPTEKHVALAAERRVNIAEEAEKFRDWCISTGATKKDWDATFRNWIRNARPSQQAPATKRPPHVSQLHASPPPGLSPEESDQWAWGQHPLQLKAQ